MVDRVVRVAPVALLGVGEVRLSPEGGEPPAEGEHVEEGLEHALGELSGDRDKVMGAPVPQPGVHLPRGQVGLAAERVHGLVYVVPVYA